MTAPKEGQLGILAEEGYLMTGASAGTEPSRAMATPGSHVTPPDHPDDHVHVTLDLMNSLQPVWTRPVTFPGADNPVQLRNSFRVINAWARHLREWGIKVRAICLIVQARLDISDDEVLAVAGLFKGEGKDHSPAGARKVMREAREKRAALRAAGLAADVVGHPPENPFQEPIEPQP